MNKPKPQYQVTLYTTEDHRHSSFAVQGLLDLEKENYILLKLKSLPVYVHNRYVLSAGELKFKRKGYPWCIELLVSETKSRKSIRIGIDLQDWVDQFSFHSFQKCDLLYKRALTISSSKAISRIKKNFVIPFGPNCKTIVSDKRFIRIRNKIYIRNLILKALLNPSKVLNKISHLRFRTFSRNSITKKDNFLKNPPKRNYIFFQVQYHDWGSSHSNVINEFRANIIRKLKIVFKDQFYGGMWFQDRINKKYADCITNIDTEFDIYNSFMNNASVVISTNGFGGSIPWKMVEYMRIGKCIVSQKNQHLLRKPIEEGIIANFKTTDECVKLCKELLKDNETISKMAQQSREYYEDYLKPSAVMKQIINESIGLL